MRYTKLNHLFRLSHLKKPPCLIISSTKKVVYGQIKMVTSQANPRPVTENAKRINQDAADLQKKTKEQQRVLGCYLDPAIDTFIRVLKEKAVSADFKKAAGAMTRESLSAILAKNVSGVNLLCNGIINKIRGHITDLRMCKAANGFVIAKPKIDQQPTSQDHAYSNQRGYLPRQSSEKPPH